MVANFIANTQGSIKCVQTKNKVNEKRVEKIKKLLTNYLIYDIIITERKKRGIIKWKNFLKATH